MSPRVGPPGGVGAAASPKDIVTRKRDHLRRCFGALDAPAGGAGCYPAPPPFCGVAAVPRDGAPVAPPHDTRAIRTSALGHNRSRSRTDARTTRTSANAPAHPPPALIRLILLIGLDISTRMCESPSTTGRSAPQHPDPFSSKASAHPRLSLFRPASSAYRTAPSRARSRAR